MNPYESGAVIDMNMGHNSATPAPIGADAVREALKWAAAALQAIASDGDTVRDKATGETRSVGQILDAADAALASAAQPVAVPPAQPRKETTMTDAAPEALRLAHALDGGKLIDDSTEWADTLHAAADELRRLHARVQELERERDNYKLACDEWQDKTLCTR